MGYEVEFMPEAINKLEELDKVLADRILKKIKWFLVILRRLFLNHLQEN